MSERYRWAKIRAQYESGATVRSLVEQYGCSRRSVELHARSEGWTRPLDWDQKRSRMVASEGRIGDYATTPITPGEILQRHKLDWQRLLPLHHEAVRIAKTAQTERALQAARLVRLLADGLKELQAGERLAWAIAPGDQPPEIDDATLELEIQRASARIAEARQRRDDDGAPPTVH